MRHSGNTATRIDQTYGGEGVTMKVYVHDEVGQFVTVARLSLGTKDVEALLSGIARRRAELDQPALFGDEGPGDDDEAQWRPPAP